MVLDGFGKYPYISVQGLSGVHISTLKAPIRKVEAGRPDDCPHWVKRESLECRSRKDIGTWQGMEK